MISRPSVQFSLVLEFARPHCGTALDLLKVYSVVHHRQEKERNASAGKGGGGQSHEDDAAKKKRTREKRNSPDVLRKSTPF